LKLSEIRESGREAIKIFIDAFERVEIIRQGIEAGDKKLLTAQFMKALDEAHEEISQLYKEAR
jgi:hypothetical protein